MSKTIESFAVGNKVSITLYLGKVEEKFGKQDMIVSFVDEDKIKVLQDPEYSKSNEIVEWEFSREDLRVLGDNSIYDPNFNRKIKIYKEDHPEYQTKVDLIEKLKTRELVWQH